MKLKTFFWLTIVVILPFGCTSSRQTSDGVPFIDVRRNHPVKEIVLTDIADITFVHLDASDDDFLFSGGVFFATENRFVVGCRSSNSVLFFSRDGKPISRFNRLGQGPEEYTNIFFNGLIYDEATDEVFVPVVLRNFIQVYSSTGEHKRKINLPSGVNISVGSAIASFDDQSLLLYDHNRLSARIRRKNAGDNLAFSPGLDSAFMLISRTDGRLIEYVKMPSPTIDLSIRNEGGGSIFGHRVVFTKHTEGFLLCTPGNDTIFLFCRNRTLTPVLRKIPLMSDGNRRILENMIDTGKYQFVSVSDRRTEIRQDSRREFLVRNKETGEVFRQRLTLPYFQGREFFIQANLQSRFLENEYFFTLGLSELKQAYRENRLSGKLKELVTTLNEDEDNDVLMILRFRQHDSDDCNA